MTEQLPSSGWYDDPGDPTQQRFWNGTAWTDQRRPKFVPIQPKPKGPPFYRRPWFIPTAVGIVALLVGIGIGSAGNTDSNSASEGPTVQRVTLTAPAQTLTADAVTITAPARAIHVTKTVTPPKPIHTGPKTTFGDGIWFVGKDIAAGTYVTNGAHSCYWERDRDLTGGINSIIANDLPSGGHAIVTILPSDKAFDSERCGTWHRVSG